MHACPHGCTSGEVEHFVWIGDCSRSRCSCTGEVRTQSGADGVATSWSGERGLLARVCCLGHVLCSVCGCCGRASVARSSTRDLLSCFFSAFCQHVLRLVHWRPGALSKFPADWGELPPEVTTMLPEHGNCAWFRQCVKSPSCVMSFRTSEQWVCTFNDGAACRNMFFKANHSHLPCEPTVTSCPCFMEFQTIMFGCP